MLSKKTPYGEDMEVQTEYKWTTGCGFICWVIFLMLFFIFAGFKYESLSTIKSQSHYQSMESLLTIPIVVNGTGITPKFRINLNTKSLQVTLDENLSGDPDSLAYQKQAAKLICD